MRLQMGSGMYKHLPVPGATQGGQRGRQDQEELEGLQGLFFFISGKGGGHLSRGVGVGKKGKNSHDQGWGRGKSTAPWLG